MVTRQDRLYKTYRQFCPDQQEACQDQQGEKKSEPFAFCFLGQEFEGQASGTQENSRQQKIAKGPVDLIAELHGDEGNE